MYAKEKTNLCKKCHYRILYRKTIIKEFNYDNIKNLCFI